MLSLAAAAGLIVWLFAAQSLSMLLDRIHVANLNSAAVKEVRYDNGVIEVAGIRLDTLTPETMPSGVTVELSSNGRAAFLHRGKSFSCGPGRSLAAPSGLPDIIFTPDPGDTVTFSAERSHMSWPTPLAMNFMTGSAPSWKRHLYCELAWTKRSGASMRILWRFEQGYFNPEGWRPKSIEYGTAGLLDVTLHL